MSYLKMLQQIKKKEVPPIILLYGSEPFFIQNIVNELTKTLKVDSNENQSTYDLEETPIEEVVADVETYPFFGEKKLVIANNPVFLKAKSPRLTFEHSLQHLEQYIEQPVDYSVLVLIAPYEKLDNRKKITKLLNKKVSVAACNPIKENEMTSWIKNISEELKITITDEANELFKANLTINLHLIQNELTKIATYVGENGVVTKEVAEDLISYTENSSALHLADAVIDRNLKRAISIYKDLERMNEEPIALIGLLAYQFRMIFRVKLLKQKGYSPFQMRKQIEAHPYAIQIANERENRFTKQRLGAIMDGLTNTDAIIKQGKMDKELAFELLLYNLIQKK